MFALRILGYLLCLLSPFVCFADYEEGRQAANLGQFELALEKWLPLAQQGEVEAQFSVGRLYANGDGVGQDFAEARRWFELAGRQSHPHALFNLGQMYQFGDGIQSDLDVALEYYQLAARAGSQEALRKIASLNPSLARSLGEVSEREEQENDLNNLEEGSRILEEGNVMPSSDDVLSKPNNIYETNLSPPIRNSSGEEHQTTNLPNNKSSPLLLVIAAISVIPLGIFLRSLNKKRTLPTVLAKEEISLIFTGAETRSAQESKSLFLKLQKNNYHIFRRVLYKGGLYEFEAGMWKTPSLHVVVAIYGVHLFDPKTWREKIIGWDQLVEVLTTEDRGRSNAILAGVVANPFIRGKQAFMAGAVGAMLEKHMLLLRYKTDRDDEFQQEVIFSTRAKDLIRTKIIETRGFAARHHLTRPSPTPLLSLGA